MIGYIVLSVGALLLLGCAFMAQADKQAKKDRENDDISRRLRAYSDEYNRGR